MKRAMDQLREFHASFRHHVAEKVGTMPDEKTRHLRARLVLEEAIEFCNACGFEVYHPYFPLKLEPGNPDTYPKPTNVGVHHKHFVLGVRKQGPSMSGMIDALIDGLYVHFGGFLSLGIQDPEPFFDEVHRANMAKLDAKGQPVKDLDGKTLKPKGWRAPDMLGVLRKLTG